ncbi:MAG: hypothetical protein NT075_02260 [Chloroflexi bacterium]|nr:hypothetical protein [Chloroflexota bacterium]
MKRTFRPLHLFVVALLIAITAWPAAVDASWIQKPPLATTTPCLPRVSAANPQLTATASNTPTVTPSPTAISSDTPTPDPCAIPTTTSTPSNTPTPCPTILASERQVEDVTPTPIVTATETATPTPTSTSIATASATATIDPCTSPTAQPAPTDTATPCAQLWASGQPAAVFTTPTFVPTEPIVTPTATSTAPATSTATATPAPTLIATETLTPIATNVPCATPPPCSACTAMPTTTPTATMTPSTSSPDVLLAIHKQAPALVTAKTPFTYMLTVRNEGQQAQSTLIIRDQLPANATYLSASTGGHLIFAPDGTKRVEWPVSSLASGASTSVQMVVSSTTTLINDQYVVLVNDALAATGAPVLTLITKQMTTGSIDQQSGGSITTADGALHVSFPSGAVAAPINVTIATVDQPLSSAGFAGLAFNITAVDANGNAVTTFLQPLTIVVQYQDSDWQNAGLADERALKLFYWDGQTWVQIPACSACSQDTVTNRITVVLNHLTLFALRKTASLVYLPLIAR